MSQTVKESAKPPANKYAIRAPKDLNSKFIRNQAAKLQKQIDDENESIRQMNLAKLMVCPNCLCYWRDCFCAVTIPSDSHSVPTFAIDIIMTYDTKSVCSTSIVTHFDDMLLKNICYV